MIIIKTEQSKLLQSLQSVSGIVERRHTLPILANVLIRKSGSSVEMTTSDIEVQIKANAELGGADGEHATSVSARKLIDILKSMPSDQVVTVTSAKNKVTVAGGKSKFTLQTLAAEDFPVMADRDDYGPVFSVPQAAMKDLIHQTHFAMAVHDIRYYLNGLLFTAEGTSLKLVATDGHRLALAEATLATPIPKQEVILPRKAVLELWRLLKDAKGAPPDAMIDMRFSDKQAEFVFNGLQFITKLVEGKFPDFNRVIPKFHKHHANVSRPAFLASLQRAAILTSEKFKGVNVSFSSDTLKIASSNAEQEEAKEEIEIDYAGTAMEIGFNVTYLIEGLNNMAAEQVRLELQDGNSSALLTVADMPGFKYVVMPMRI